MTYVIRNEAIVDCPICFSKFHVQMPQIAKHLSCRCVFCKVVFRIKEIKECCVYCRYSDTSCPERQKTAYLNAGELH